MRGKGTFFDPRLNDKEKFPVAVKTGDWNIRNDPDLVTAKLPALDFYQLSIVALKPPEGKVEFEAHFAKPGIYKAWGQFQRGGKVHVVAFVSNFSWEE